MIGIFRKILAWVDGLFFVKRSNIVMGVDMSQPPPDPMPSFRKLCKKAAEDLVAIGAVSSEDSPAIERAKSAEAMRYQRRACYLFVGKDMWEDDRPSGAAFCSDGTRHYQPGEIIRLLPSGQPYAVRAGGVAGKI